MTGLGAVTEGAADGRHPPADRIALETTGLTKRFGALVANDDVGLRVPGETIHALVGENGAGKTTLMRMIYGLYVPDSGTIRLHGKPVAFGSPRDALAHGVAMVHQTSLLVGSLSVAENVMLSLAGRSRSPRRAVIERLARLSGENGLGIDPRAVVDSLSVGMRQRAEILGALYHDAKLLILDEPTTVLTPKEAARLFAVLRDVTTRGTTVVLVTHKLREVLAVTQNVTVLRGGKVVAEAPTAELDEKKLVRLMVGRDVSLTVSETHPVSGPAPVRESPTLEVEDLVVVDKIGCRRVDGVSLSVHPGEIVAVTGVEGNGQRELVETIVGLQRSTAGRIRLGGVDVTSAGIGRRRRQGLGYIPESRPTDGLANELPIEDNLVLGQHRRAAFARNGLRRIRATRDFAVRQIADFDVVASGPGVAVGTLSGGNAQKVVVAREVSKQPKVLLAVQPTQGVDVAAAFAIRQTLRRLRDEGMSILLVTSDLREACDLCDRAVVLYNGSIAGELDRSEATEESLGGLAMGVTA
ncbi:ABC transporter ATP-binding protein [Streptosporangium sp. NPDC087985]|uniref:ABC transporter ATP-binding protein n=1 Tax=Streptosporangium sp. NPDC087985 TaxID=3366196 RepID=UPI0037FE84E3